MGAVQPHHMLQQHAVLLAVLADANQMSIHEVMSTCVTLQHGSVPAGNVLTASLTCAAAS